MLVKLFAIGWAALSNWFIGGSPRMMYEIATDRLVQVAKHDPERFGDVGVAATPPFNQDEESSGIIDVSDILGDGSYLLDSQAHYPINSGNPNGFANPDELVEGGQLLFMHVPAPATLRRFVHDDGYDGDRHHDDRAGRVTLVLNGIVDAGDISAGAFALAREHGPAFDFVVDSVRHDGTTRITLSLGRHGRGRHALPAGRYTLTVDGSFIKDGLGQAADMDGDGYAGGIRTLSFRAYGDDDDPRHRDR